MPGLCGLVWDNTTDLGLCLERMGKALHAGHEQVQDRWVSEATGVALGRESLGVVNPAPQPVLNSVGTLALVMEGEFSDVEALRRQLDRQGYPAMAATDPELALYLFECEGVEGLSRLNGIFALAIWDMERRQLTLANDRFGLRPLYYTHAPGLFAFAGEIKGLLALDSVSREMDDGAVADLFAYGYVLGNKTLFREIHLLPPATVLTVRDDVVEQRAYWCLEYRRVGPDRPDEVWVEELTHLLAQAVARRLQNDTPVGLSLSGGLDSRTLLAVATQALGVFLPTYTYGLPGSRDIHRAQQIAKLVGVPHRTLYLEENYLSAYAEESAERTDGLLNCLNSHGFALHAMAEECPVAILGNGGDSFFLAFRSFRPQILDMEGDLISVFYRATNHPFSDREAARVFSEAYYPRVKGRAFASLESTLAALMPNSVDNVYDAHRLREYNRRSLLQGLATINHRLEYSEPYYDYDLVDFAMRVPVHLRWDRKIHEMVLARLSPALAHLPLRVPSTPTGMKRVWRRGWRRLGRLGARLGAPWPSGLGRGSYAFTDRSYLLRAANREWVEDVLLSPRTLERGYFRSEAIRQIVTDHMSGRHNRSGQLGVLLTFELWHRCFIDGVPTSVTAAGEKGGIGLGQ